ncbi:MAG: primosomal protein N' [Hyphomicrobiaceae bacterium]|nr:primosomal protein N' [Hyphomicrobiaceae bacterium]
MRPALVSNDTVPVLLPLAIEAPYDYRVPADMQLTPGDFVIVPLATRERVGVIWDGALARDRPAVDPSKLRDVIDKIDMPPLPAESLQLVEWVAGYTLTPPGMVLRMMMSAREAFMPPKPRVGVRLTGAPPDRMTSARSRVLEAAAGGLLWPKRELVETAGVSPGVIDGLVDAGTLSAEPLPPERPDEPDADHAHARLTQDQQRAADTLIKKVEDRSFSATVLDGVTGSGKTPVYFEAVAAALRSGRQALILLPEIALTRQFVQAFEQRFGCAPVEWHSDLTPRQRGLNWRAAAQGEARVVVGARSALFLPFTELGLIVVDEEHDASFKQVERVSYHARDMAVVRASIGGFAVVLSSATPSVESLVNVRQGRYGHVALPRRFTGVSMPDIEAIDLRKAPPEKGSWLSPVLIKAAQDTLADKQQALLFLNRRGYAPLTLCRACGFRFECPQCAAWLVEHRFRHQLRCHHCGYSTKAPDTCPSCGAEDSLVPCGPGVERIAEEVRSRFPEARTAILSSDLAPNVTALREILDAIARGDADIIIGTQLVAKGHHFPQLATVGVIDGDLGLGQGDPRAAERTFQLLSQVTGRAGRERISGKGFIQTYMPEHPVLQALISGDRDAFLEQEIAVRQSAGYPPFGRLASLVVSATSMPQAMDYARAVATRAPQAEKIHILGPAEAPLSVIRGRHRVRILIKATRETDIQAYLRQWLAILSPPKGSVRLAVDIDPYNFM